MNSDRTRPLSTALAPSERELGLPRHAEAHCEVVAAARTVFDYIDSPQRLSAHMARRSWQLGGASMTIRADDRGGRAVGSRVVLAGDVLGMRMEVEVEVVQRESPRLKAWQTVGEPRLLVIGRYAMKVTIEPRGASSRVIVGIDYALPPNIPARWLGALLGPAYARWCVRQMVRDIGRQFGA